MPYTPPTVLDILDRTRLFLNDTGADLYTDAVLLPILGVANDEFRDELLVHGINSQKTVADYYTVAIGETTLDPLPDDFLTPVEIWERLSGSSDNFTKVVEFVWPTGYTGSDNGCLAYWNFRNQEITFPPANTEREVRLDYNRVLVEAVSTSDTVEIKGSVNFLAAKVAELAAADIGQNPVESDKNGARAAKYLMRLLQINIKNQQGTGARRLPFRRHTGLRIF